MRHQITFLLVVCLVFLGGYALFSSEVIEGVEFTGRLVDGGGTPITGTHPVDFSIWNDPSTGTRLWETPASISVTTDAEGYFTVVLGPMSSTVFSEDADLGRWVQIQIVSSSPITPRTELPHSAYSVTSTGVEGTGVSVSGTEGITMDRSAVDTFDTMRATVYEAKASMTGAEMNLYDPDGIHRYHVSSSPAGATMELYGGDTIPALSILPDGRNGLDVQFPDNVIQAHEILDEPGLAMSRRLSTQALDTAAMTNIVSVTILVPTTGYVLVQAKSVIELNGGTGFGAAWLQIDTAAGGTADDISFAAIGGDRASPGSAFNTTSLQRTYLVAPGSHTFSLEGQMVPGSTVGIEAAAQASQISALFIPTSYGGMFAALKVIDEMPPVAEDSLPPSLGLPLIREDVYDLREIERRIRNAEADLSRVKEAVETLRKTESK